MPNTIRILRVNYVLLSYLWEIYVHEKSHQSKKTQMQPWNAKKKKKKENFCIENDMPTYITYKQQIQKN